MEQYCHDLYSSLREVAEVELLANRKGKKGIPLFALRALIHLLLRAGSYTHVHFGDAKVELVWDRPGPRTC